MKRIKINSAQVSKLEQDALSRVKGGELAEGTVVIHPLPCPCVNGTWPNYWTTAAVKDKQTSTDSKTTLNP
ncbi:MAG: hypothetical protein IJ421_06305 [Prevotella sp.]|nr:hypothetical protein [Prevotella sp.]